jgi:type II secretory ATPase GspE/PulE/Tfp pilus assembly ATPase PilB-like protein
MTRKILCPIDYSAASDSALRDAVALAAQSGATLLVAHVELPSTPPLGTAESPQELAAREHREVVDLLARLCASDGRSVPYEFRALRGDPAAEIVRLARQEPIESIVMATSGRSGLRRLLMGSVAETVVREAPCPVLTLKQPHAANGKKTNAEGAPAAEEEPAAPDFREDPQAAVAQGGSIAVSLLQHAIRSRATDVHIDPLGDAAEVRFRVDGRLEPYCRLAREVAHPLVMQLKVMAEVNIANPFHTEEGRFSLPSPMTYDVRLTRVPVIGGESIALRLLNFETLLRPLDLLGLTDESLAQIHDMLRLGEGVVLVTGPTGSGKTTTAYSMAYAMDDGHRNIVTMEDPVEYRIPNFRQMSVDPRHGVTMTSGLRTLLRMDPDVVLVGEIRDAETAEMAMRAASSGKHVFTTIHTRDVASTVTALRDLHIDNRSLAGNLTGIISQRLVRRVCAECCRKVPIDGQQAQCFRDEGLEPPEELVVAEGCKKCRNTGYHQRVGIFEMVLPDRDIREAIEHGASEHDLRDTLRSRGTRSLLADGLRKARDGITTLDEVRSMTWVSFPDG